MGDIDYPRFRRKARLFFRSSLLLSLFIAGFYVSVGAHRKDVVTVFKNGSATPVTCTIAEAATCSGLVASINTVSGDVITVKIVSTRSPSWFPLILAAIYIANAVFFFWMLRRDDRAHAERLKAMDEAAARLGLRRVTLEED